MRMAFARSIVLAAALTLAAGNAPAAPETASAFVAWLGDRTVSVLRSADGDLGSREARFRDLLGEGFDIPFMARFTLGPNWRRATPEQRNDYLDVFGEYVVQTYSARLGGYTGEAMNVIAERRAGERDSVVETEIVRASGAPITVEWRVRVIAGEYRIIDIAIEGISMAVTKRSEFSAVIQSSGIDGLIAALRLRANKIPATASRN